MVGFVGLALAEAVMGLADRRPDHNCDLKYR